MDQLARITIKSKPKPTKTQEELDAWERKLRALEEELKFRKMELDFCDEQQIIRETNLLVRDMVVCRREYELQLKLKGNI